MSYLFVAGYWKERAGGTSGSMKKIRREQILALHVPVPSVEHQRQITDWLREARTVVERARVAAEAQVRSAAELEQACLDDLFSHERMALWSAMPLGTTGRIASGVTLGRRLTSEATRTVPYLRVANVKDGHLDLTNVRSVPVTEGEFKKWRLEPGDLLLTEGGDPDKLGRGTVWSNEIPRCIHQNHIFRVRLDRGQVLPEFVAAQIGSPYGKAYFLRHAKQTTGIATINQQVLSAFPLRRPSLDEQGRIMVPLRSRRAAVGPLRERLSAQLAEVRAFPSALLRRAFSGEL